MTIQDLIVELLKIPSVIREEKQIKIKKKISKTFLYNFPVEKEMLRRDEEGNCIIKF